MALLDWFCLDVLSEEINVEKIWEDERVLPFYRPRHRVHRRYYGGMVDRGRVSRDYYQQ